jgi:hypothetical protein
VKYSLIFFFLPLFFALGQEPEASSTATASLPGGLELKFGFSYYRPNLDSLNTLFSDLEDQLGFEPWGKSALLYNVSAEARYPVFPGWVVAEIAGGFFRRSRDEDRSWTNIWRGGAGFRYQLPLPVIPIRVAVQGTLGFVWASISRSYRNNAVVLNAAGNSWYATVSGAGDYQLVPGVALELSAGYTYVNPFTTSTPEAKIDLKSPVVGMGLVVEL